MKKRISSGAKSAPDTRAVAPRSRDGNPPMSFAQQRLWFLCRLEGGPPYHTPRALRISGALNLDTLARSLGEIVRRHEALRTAFALEGGRPVQLIRPPKPLHVPVVDLSPLAADERERAARRLVNEEVLRPFDLSEGDLLRVKVLRLADDEHIAVMTIHHIASDGWSMGILIRELTTLYKAFAQGEPSPLPELTIQYADFAVWQREHLGGEVLEEQLSYWRKQLDGAPPALELPTDRPRPAVQTFRGAKHQFKLSPELTEDLKALARREGVTLYMLLLAAFQTLLMRYSGQDDIVVGSPIANRNRAETEGLIGFFVNALAMRTDLSGDPTFEELLGRVKDVALGAYAHQDLPFEKLIEELQPERSLSHTPLFQVTFAFHNAPTESLSLGGLELRSVEVTVEAAKFDLSLLMGESNQGTAGLFEYRSDLFDEETMRRFSSHFKNLLEAVAADPSRRLSALQLLGAEERERTLAGWNSTAADYPADTCVHRLFEARAEQTPDAVALVSEDARISYAELDARANKLAHYLRGLGVGPEVRVGVLMERSIEMVVALLGVLKAGGAYVPLDPNYPQERLAFMLDDARVELLITESHLAEKRPPEFAGALVRLDSDWKKLEAESGAKIESGATGDNLAYVIYTSGSTGRPKGVEVAHKGLTNLVRWHERAFEVAPGDRAAQTAGSSFDACVWELWPYLAAGACVCIVDEETRLSPSQLRDWIIGKGITHCFLTTPLAENVIALDWPQGVALRVLLTGADRLRVWPPPSLPFKLINNYGVTECAVVSTSGVVERGEAAGATPHIGRPVDNTEIYILDGFGNPSPVGVPGEIHIGGDGLARGYARQAALTAERFVPNPFSRKPGARLYRSGDWARYLPGGEIEFTGTRESRVKLRGHRVETGEVEVTLGRHAAVRECVVVAAEDTRGETHLVAYVVPSEETLAVSELREALGRTLPQYMIPSAFVTLDALPLTPHGKVNRAALPAPDWGRPETREAPLAPRDAWERRLAGIWEEVLGLEQVGVRDNFFELGGHSLLAVRLLARVEESLGKRLALSSLFQGATVERQAALLRRAGENRRPSSLVRVHAGGAGAPFFFAHPVGGMTLCYYALAKRLGVERPVYGFQATEENETKSGLEEVAAAYVEELIEAQAVGPYLLGGWSAGGVIAFEMARQLRRRGREVALVALLDTRSPLLAAKTPGRADDAGFLKALAEEYALWRGKRLQLSQEALQSLGAEAQLDYVLRRLQESGLLPPGEDATNPARWREVVSVYRNTARMVAGYVPRRFEGRVTLLRASDTPRKRAAARAARPTGEVREQRAGRDDEALGWNDFTSSPVRIHFIPGDHFSMMTEPNVRVVAERLSACIKQIGVE